jgi:long-subunit acyl-CoA synthetase (AMP-forming)
MGWFVRNTYGVSECGGAATISNRTAMVPGELGGTVEGMTVDITDDGEVLLAGTSMMRGYVGSPPLAPGEPFATGDLVSRHREALRFECRRSRLVSIGGERINLDHLERSAAAALPAANVVIVPVDGALSLYAFGVSVTADDLRSMLASPPVAAFRAVVLAAVIGRGLDGANGEIGPTGKVRRWRVHELWADHLAPVTAAILV